MGTDLIIRGQRIVLPKEITSASLHIRDGRFEKISSYDDVNPSVELINVEEQCVVMPGLVDTHVHVNEPGRTHWEGFATATRAAAAGGVTTIVDMPLNSIPATTTSSAFQEKLDSARGKCSVDTAFWGGVVPGNTRELEPLFAAGVVGFKCFLVPSGVDEFPHVTEEDLRQALPELKRLGAVLIVHAELQGPIDQATTTATPSDYQGFLASRPRAAENEAVALMINLSREFDARVHIVHHSSADALPMLREALREGVKITAETCPHYLFFSAEEIRTGATEFKCCPPIRERENREKLWQALAEDTIQMIVSDHSPCPPEMKLQERGDFLAAWGGISSLQLRLPIVWTEARRRGHSIEKLVEWLCFAPSALVNFEKRKGGIEVGYDADLVIWDPSEEFTVSSEKIWHRHKLTPYAGERLAGVIKSTFLRGRKIFDGGNVIESSTGQLLLLGAEGLGAQASRLQ
jgi:allantoinase